VSAADERVTAARQHLTLARELDPDRMPPSRLVAEVTESRRQLAAVLGVLAERQDDARQLAAIRAVLAGFDWEFDDRQLALERIERIAEGVE
jgi:hypothetical protein